MMQLHASNLPAQRSFTLERAWASEVKHRTTVVELLAQHLCRMRVSLNTIDGFEYDQSQRKPVLTRRWRQLPVVGKNDNSRIRRPLPALVFGD